MFGCTFVKMKSENKFGLNQTRHLSSIRPNQNQAMTLSYNLSAGIQNAHQSFPGILPGGSMQSESVQYWPTTVISKAKKGNGLVIGSYTIGDAVSADLFGHPAIRY